MCKPKSLKLCDDENCKTCFLKSFASFDYEKVNCWSPKNKLTARQVFKYASDTRYIFECDICYHLFNNSPGSVSAKNLKKRQWCPFCSHQKLCDNDDCQMCFDNSFASHPKAECWSDNND